MPVQDHESGHALPRERLREIAQHQTLRARLHVDTERDVELPGLHAEGDRGQHDDARAAVPRQPRRLGGDVIALDHVGGIRKVIVVRLGRAPWQNGDVERRLANGLPVRLGEDVRAGTIAIGTRLGHRSGFSA